ncbi:MAG: hypothetical protein JKY92_01970 [Magnetovibrio sp.]|nr:hypothetical protein [Magnetovibrio sp.]
MKKNDKYPGASGEQINNLKPAPKVLGLHPLIWVVIVIIGIAGARACDKVEDLGCHFFEWYDVEDDPGKPGDDAGNYDEEDDQGDNRKGD